MAAAVCTMLDMGVESVDIANRRRRRPPRSPNSKFDNGKTACTAQGAPGCWWCSSMAVHVFSRAAAAPIPHAPRGPYFPFFWAPAFYMQGFSEAHTTGRKRVSCPNGPIVTALADYNNIVPPSYSISLTSSAPLAREASAGLHVPGLGSTRFGE